eukprot:scaffold569_cov408-Prasinococcus_capsulatus_cf.AAC.54
MNSFRVFCQGESYSHVYTNANQPWPDVALESERMHPELAFQLLLEAQDVRMWIFEDGVPSRSGFDERTLSSTSELLVHVLNQRMEGKLPDYISIALVVEEQLLNPPPGDLGATGGLLPWLPMALACQLDGVLVRTYQDSESYQYFLPHIGQRMYWMPAWAPEVKDEISKAAEASRPESIWANTNVEELPYIFVSGDEYLDVDIVLEAIKPIPIELVVATDNNFYAAQCDRTYKYKSDRAENKCTVYRGLQPSRMRLQMARAMFVVVPLNTSQSGAGLSSFLEAQALGKMTITTKSHTWDGYATDGWDTLMVPKDNLLLMRSAIYRLLDEPGLLSNMESNVRVKRQQSSLEQVAQNLQSFARTVILRTARTAPNAQENDARECMAAVSKANPGDLDEKRPALKARQGVQKRDPIPRGRLEKLTVREMVNMITTQRGTEETPDSPELQANEEQLAPTSTEETDLAPLSDESPVLVESHADSHVAEAIQVSDKLPEAVVGKDEEGREEEQKVMEESGMVQEAGSVPLLTLSSGLSKSTERDGIDERVKRKFDAFGLKYSPVERRAQLDSWVKRLKDRRKAAKG